MESHSELPELQELVVATRGGMDVLLLPDDIWLRVLAYLPLSHIPWVILCRVTFCVAL